MNTTKAKQEAAAEAVSNLPDFLAGTLYDIQLSRPVEFPPGSQNYFRPGETHHIDGALCQQWKDAISGATAVGEPGTA